MTESHPDHVLGATCPDGEQKIVFTYALATIQLRH
jgi:hypothetical protein